MVITDISIPLKYVFTQATEPDDKTEGKLWYNTSDNSLYTSNGTDYVKLGIDTTFFNEIFNNSLDILDIQAQETLEGGQSAYMVRDLFTDADGYLDTIDTGNTTANFSSKSYDNAVLTNKSESLYSYSSTQGTSAERGIFLEIGNEDIYLKTVVKGSGDQSSTCIIKDSSLNLISEANFSGTTATFNNIKLSKNTTYIIGTKHTSSRNVNDIASSFPLSKTDLNIIGGYNGNLTPVTTTAWSIASINYDIASEYNNLIVQTNKQDLNLEPSNFQVYAHKQTLSDTGNITASVSFDNGANYQTVNLNTTTPIINKGDEMILKLNLNAGASNGLASCGGYGVMFW